jgi:hypothetical protein
MANTTSASRTAAATGGVAGVAVGSLGTLVFAITNRDWSTACAVGGTIVWGLLAYLMAHGGLIGVTRTLIGIAPPRRRRRRRAASQNPAHRRRAAAAQSTAGTP